MPGAYAVSTCRQVAATDAEANPAVRRASACCSTTSGTRVPTRRSPDWRFDRAGFDLFSFPSNARLIGFDLDRLCRRAGAAGAPPSLGRCGVAPRAVRCAGGGPGGRSRRACRARGRRPSWPASTSCMRGRCCSRSAPEANTRLPGARRRLRRRRFPTASAIRPSSSRSRRRSRCWRRASTARADLHAHTRFGRRELWVIRRLVEPFERVARRRLPQAGSAHRMMLEEPVHGAAVQPRRLYARRQHACARRRRRRDVPGHAGLHALRAAEPSATRQSRRARPTWRGGS